MDVLDDRVPWDEPDETPTATEYLALLDVELQPVWESTLDAVIEAVRAERRLLA